MLRQTLGIAIGQQIFSARLLKTMRCLLLLLIPPSRPFLQGPLDDFLLRLHKSAVGPEVDGMEESKTNGREEIQAIKAKAGSNEARGIYSGGR